MSLNFETVDRILKEEFGLETKSSDKGKYVRHRYFFKDRFIYHRKSDVLREIVELKNGGIGGYIYVEHLEEYKNHLDKTKKGHLHIGKMSVQELREITTKVTKEYK